MSTRGFVKILAGLGLLFFAGLTQAQGPAAEDATKEELGALVYKLRERIKNEQANVKTSTERVQALEAQVAALIRDVGAEKAVSADLDARLRKSEADSCQPSTSDVDAWRERLDKALGLCKQALTKHGALAGENVESDRARLYECGMKFFERISPARRVEAPMIE